MRLLEHIRVEPPGSMIGFIALEDLSDRKIGFSIWHVGASCEKPSTSRIYSVNREIISSDSLVCVIDEPDDKVSHKML